MPDPRLHHPALALQRSHHVFSPPGRRQDPGHAQAAQQAALQKLEVPDPRQSQGGYPGPTQGSPRFGGAGTTLYDAVFLASDEVANRQQGRKALIILSDGVDMGSRVSLNRAIEAAQRSDTLVYTILFSDAQAYNNMAGGHQGGGHGGGFPGGGYPGGGCAQGRPDG